MPLHSTVLKNLFDLGYKSMAPIQTRSLPQIVSGGDDFAQDKSGFRNTLAFGLSILSKIEVKSFSPTGLVLCPNTEDCNKKVPSQSVSYAVMDTPHVAGGK